jgi:hypothetical protein
VGGISVHGLEDGQEINMHRDQLELGKVVDLGPGTGILCIVVERYCVMIFLIQILVTVDIYDMIDMHSSHLLDTPTYCDQTQVAQV